MRLSSLNSIAQEPNILHRHTHCKVALVTAIGSSLLGIVASAASILDPIIGFGADNNTTAIQGWNVGSNTLPHTWKVTSTVDWNASPNGVNFHHISHLTLRLTATNSADNLNRNELLLDADTDEHSLTEEAVSIPLILDETSDGGSPLQTMDFDQLPLTQWDSVSEVTLSNDSDSVVYDADVGSNEPTFRHTNTPSSTSDDTLYLPDALTADPSLESRRLQLSQDNYASWSITVANSVNPEGMTDQQKKDAPFSLQEVNIHFKVVPEPSSIALLSLSAVGLILRRKR